MKKLTVLAIMAVLVSTVITGCTTLGDHVKVTERKKVPYGKTATFTPTSKLGGYAIGVRLSADLAKQVAPAENGEAFQAAALAGDVTLLVGMAATNSVCAP
jgi:hypothetical protein